MGYINEQQLEDVQIRIKEISNKINALKNSQYQRIEQINNSTNNQP